MEKVHSEQVEFVLTIRRRRRRRIIARAPVDSAAGDSVENSSLCFTSQHLLSLCFGAYIIVGAIVCPPVSTTIAFDHYYGKSLSLFEKRSKLTKPLSPTLSYLFEMQNGYVYNTENFKSRPIRIRYRNDQFLLESYQYDSTLCANAVVCPLLAEDHNYAWSQGPSSSSYVAEQLTSSGSVNTHRWNREPRTQKSSFFPFTEGDFYDTNLSSLTGKSTRQPLSSSELAVYQNSAKDFYAGYLTQTERHRCCSVNLSGPTDDLRTSNSWITESQISRFDDKEGASTANSYRSSYNATFLDSDNPVLHDVSLSQSASLSQNSSLVSRNSYIPSRNETFIAIEQDENVVESTSSLSPTLTLSDTEFDQFCADEQVKEDIADSVLEQMNNTSSVGDYFPDSEFTFSSSFFQQRTNSYGSLSSTQSSSSISGSNDCSSENDSFVKMSLPDISTKHKEVSRGFGKLFPEVNEDILKPVSSFRNEQQPNRKLPCPTEKEMKVVHGRRGRRSKDEILVMKFNLPATAAAISEMSLSELQRLSRSLNDEQRAVMKKIRRRGKNKVAARMCRQRKIMAPISVVSCE